MSRTYAIADIHGRLDLLKKAIARIETSPSGGTVVFLGDYIDRGPNSYGVIKRLMAGPGEPGWKWVNLAGNHEEWMIDSYNGGSSLADWLHCGGTRTLISYGHPAGRGIKANPREYVLRHHIDWLRGLPFFYEDQHRVYVHAGLDESLPLTEQKQDTMQWMLYPAMADGGYRGKHVVHGHHQFPDGPLLLEGRTDLDTMAWYTGRLVVGVFDDDKPGGPVEIWEILE